MSPYQKATYLFGVFTIVVAILADVLARRRP